MTAVVGAVRGTGRASVFTGFSDHEVDRVMGCLGGSGRTFEAGDRLCTEGEELSQVGLIVEGAVLATRTDEDGTRHLVSVVESGDVYGEDMLWDPRQRTHRSVVAAAPGRVLLIGMDKIVRPDGPLCDLRSRVVENLFRVMGEKNRYLEAYLRLMMQKSLRAKLVGFLEMEATRAGRRTFTVPLNRTQLAEFLNADRAAVSRELGRMKSEGLVDYHRNSFRLVG